MRGTIVKRIKKLVYGKNPTEVRNYKYFNKQGTIINTGLRLLYQETKEHYKRTGILG
jgi:hypothetical protein